MTAEAAGSAIREMNMPQMRRWLVAFGLVTTAELEQIAKAAKTRNKVVHGQVKGGATRHESADAIKAANNLRRYSCDTRHDAQGRRLDCCNQQPRAPRVRTRHGRSMRSDILSMTRCRGGLSVNLCSLGENQRHPTQSVVVSMQAG